MKACIVVDMQNDFADYKGALYVKDASDVIRNIARGLSAFDVVVMTQCWHPARDPSFKENGGLWPKHCLIGTWGAEIVPELRGYGDLLLRKTGYSAFFDDQGHTTGLHEWLRSQWVTSITICGLALDYCVQASAFDAAELGYRVILPRATTAPVQPAPDAIDGLLTRLKQAGVAVL